MRTRQRLINILVYTSVTCMLMVACKTDVDLCYESSHPHRAEVEFTYTWDEGVLRPDSMCVLANRIIGQWKSSMVVGTNTTPVIGYYFSTDIIPENYISDEFREYLDSATIANLLYGGFDFPVSKFIVRNGEYKFITFNMDTTAFAYDKLMDYMLSPANEGRRLQDLNMEYKTYSKENNKGALRSLIASWTDYNPYADYIQPEMNPIYFDTTQVVRVETDVVAKVSFHPQPLTQNIDIYFNIKKDVSGVPFVIDSVRAEVSGIPKSINLSNGYLDIEHTAKMMFRMDMCAPFNLTAVPPFEIKKEADQLTKQAVGCHANIDVTGVVRNASDYVYSGPGIVQVMIWTHAKDPQTGLISRKKMQGKINIYKTLGKSDLLKEAPDGKHMIRKSKHGNIVIQANIEIDGSKIKRSDNTSVLDNWIPCDQVDVDI